MLSVVRGIDCVVTAVVGESIYLCRQQGIVLKTVFLCVRGFVVQDCVCVLQMICWSRLYVCVADDMLFKTVCVCCRRYVV